MPGEGNGFACYGGSTSCYRIRAGSEEIYLDAGSGIANATANAATNLSILLTHVHLDHLIGLPFFSALREANRPIHIYGGRRDGWMPKDCIDRLISPPFWPCRIDDYPASVTFHPLPDCGRNEESVPFAIGEVSVRMMEGTHPSGSTIYRLSYMGRSIVYATDFEHSPEGCSALARFASGCDLLLYDAQYTQDEYERHRGYGHSTPEAGIRVADESKAVQLLFVHHAPWRTDEALLEMERTFAGQRRGIMFAKIGDEIVL